MADSEPGTGRVSQLGLSGQLGWSQWSAGLQEEAGVAAAVADTAV